MKKAKAKDAVRLRQRRTKGGRVSLFLDIYVGGERRREFLRLYLTGGTSRADRDRDRETYAVAEAVCAKRLLEVLEGCYGIRGGGSDVPFFDYFLSLAEEREGATRESWLAALALLRLYERRDVALGQITRRWVQGFADFLERRPRYGREGRTLAAGSRILYFQKLTACLNRAVREGLLPSSPAAGVGRPKAVEKERVYLTMEEVRRLASARCPNPVLRRAFLFACLTGLRWSDITALRWGEVTDNGEFARLAFRQRKTGAREYLDITPQAAALMGERGAAEAPVFGAFMKRESANHGLGVWARRAGIDKHVTFHSGRHTFAVMMLDLGADIYTVSKLLGHRELSTTQVYAHLTDRKKQEAVRRIPDIGLTAP